MIQPHQPPQSARIPDGYGDPRSNYEIERHQRALHRELHILLARLAYNDQLLELREARSRESFDWPTPPPARPAPFSMPLAQRPQIHHLHAGRMGVVVKAEERRQ